MPVDDARVLDADRLRSKSRTAFCDLGDVVTADRHAQPCAIEHPTQHAAHVDVDRMGGDPVGDVSQPGSKVGQFARVVGEMGVQVANVGTPQVVGEHEREPKVEKGPAAHHGQGCGHAPRRTNRMATRSPVVFRGRTACLSRAARFTSATAKTTASGPCRSNDGKHYP